MSDQLPVDTEIIFTSGDTQSWDIDGNMKHSKEGQRKHGRNGIGQSGPIDGGKVCLQISSAFNFHLVFILTIESIEVIPWVI